MDELSGGAPLLGEPLPIELANTAYAVRGRPRDGLRTPGHLATWLSDVRLVGGEPADGEVTGEDLATARALRAAIRTIASATVLGEVIDDGAVATLNRLAAATPRWRELRTDPEPHAVPRFAGGAVAAAITAVAAEAVDLFGGPGRHELRACPGPGCVLFFMRDRPRREWCSHGCGNRARAARHYAKTRQLDRTGEPPPRTTSSRRIGAPPTEGI